MKKLNKNQNFIDFAKYVCIIAEVGDTFRYPIKRGIFYQISVSDRNIGSEYRYRIGTSDRSIGIGSEYRIGVSISDRNIGLGYRYREINIILLYMIASKIPKIHFKIVLRKFYYS